MSDHKMMLTVLLVLLCVGMVLPQAALANTGSRAQPPVVKCDLKSPSFFPLGSTVWITGTATDDKWVSLLEIITNPPNRINITSSYNNDTKRFAWAWDTSTQTAGSHTISIWVKDADNQYGVPLNIPVTLDGDDPSVSIKTPVGNNLILGLGDTIQFSGDASDATTSIAILNISFDGGNTWTNITSNYKGKTWTYSWVTKPTDKPMTHDVFVQATDVVGHTKNATITITLVDLKAPVISFTQPNDNTEVTAWDGIIIKGTATDNIGVTDLEIATTAKGATAKKSNITSRINAGTWAYTWDCKSLPAGKYVVQIWAKDRKGNQATGTLNITFSDKAAPALSVTTPIQQSSYSHGDTVFVMGKATDNVKLAKLELLVDKALPVNITSDITTGGSFQHAIPGLKDGKHTITIRATDMSANTNETAVVVKVNAAQSGVPVAAIAGGILVVVIVLILVLVAFKKGWIGGKKKPAESSTVVAGVPQPAQPATQVAPGPYGAPPTQQYPPTQPYPPAPYGQQPMQQYPSAQPVQQAPGPYGPMPLQQYQPAPSYVPAPPVAPAQPTAYQPPEPASRAPPKLELEPPVPAPVPMYVDDEEEIAQPPPPITPKVEEPRPTPTVEIARPPIPGPAPKKPGFQRPALAKNPQQAPAQCPSCGLDVDYESLICQECGAKLF